MSLIRELKQPPAAIVDFGAGTGRLAIPLGLADYRVTAVERSPAMCAVLSKKTQRDQSKIRVVNLPMGDFEEKEKYDLALCVFTTLNYLVDDDDLRQFATAAANALRTAP